jgi:AmmeMemoRadiSam system protein B
MSHARDSHRPPAVAGRFYPAGAAALRHQVEDLLADGRGEIRPACAVMAPHAGYVYSGRVAARVFAGVAVPDRVILLCPNHTGVGQRIAVYDRGSFEIPGAEIPIDEELARAVLAEVPGAAADTVAHRHEHAIEVELPFLVARQPDLRIVPIVLAGLDETQALALGAALYRAVQRVTAHPAGDVLVVASSDMSHYLTDGAARRVDRAALEPLLGFDPAALYRTVVKHDISMCGFIPATAMLAYAREARASAPVLIDYATSGEAFGDLERVVGYAGVIVPMPA